VQDAEAPGGHGSFVLQRLYNLQHRVKPPITLAAAAVTELVTALVTGVATSATGPSVLICACDRSDVSSRLLNFGYLCSC
jgi:hypothetical protein